MFTIKMHHMALFSIVVSDSLCVALVYAEFALHSQSFLCSPSLMPNLRPDSPTYTCSQFLHVENEGGHPNSNRGGSNEPGPGDFPFRDIRPTFRQSTESWRKTPRF